MERRGKGAEGDSWAKEVQNQWPKSILEAFS